MAYVFTSSELDTLQALLNEANDPSYVSSRPIATAYSDIAQWMTDAGDPSTDVIQWLEGAAEVNANDGSVFSNFIRAYTAEQALIRYNQVLSVSDLNTASDNIGKILLQEILDTNGVMQDLTFIGTTDAQASVAGVQGDLGVWSGNLLFPLLGDNSQFLTALLHSASSTSYVHSGDTYDAYDALLAIKSAIAGLGASGVFTSLAGIPTVLGLLWSNGSTTASAVGAFNQFIDDAYGDEMFTAPFFSLLLYGSNQLVIGRKDASSTLVGTSSNDVVVGGDASDVLEGSFGTDILDGGGGVNAASFANIGGPVHIVVDDAYGSGSTNENLIASVEFNGGLSYLYNIQEIDGSGNDDTIDIEKMVDGLTINGGSGTDTLNVNDLDGATTINTILGTISNAGEIIAFLNIENVSSHSENTTFVLGGSGLNLDGGDEATASFSGDTGIDLAVGLAHSSGYGDGASLETAAGTDNIFNFKSVNLSDGADTVTLAPSSLEISDDITIDAGGQPENEPDVLNLTSLGDGIVFNDGQIKGSGLTFENFELYQFGSGNDTVSTDTVNSSIYLGDGNDTLVAAAPGSIIYTGNGDDIVEFNPDTEVADLSMTDRISLGGVLNLYGGIRDSLSSSPYAIGLGGLVEYGINQDGTLIIHMPWLPNTFEVTDNGVTTTVPSDMFVANYEQNSTFLASGGQVGPGDIALATLTVTVTRLIDAPVGIDSIQSQLNYGGFLLKTLTGSDWGGEDPLVLDLGGNGFDLTQESVASPVFDLDADFYGERSAWVLPDDGFLVRDINGNGIIDNGSEMFSSSEPGLEALAALDGNGDGIVNSEDDGLVDFNGDGVVNASDVFQDLKVWVDLNQNGITDPGELHNLSDYGITGFSLATTADGEKINGNTVTATASYLRSDGSTGKVGEVLLSIDNMNSVYEGPAITLDPDVTSEPDLKGYGTLVSLHQALSLHPDLIDDVNAALATITTPDLDAIDAAVLPILYDWAEASPEQLPDGTTLSEATADPRNTQIDFLKDSTGIIDYAYDIQTGSTSVDGSERLTKTWTFVSGVTFQIIGADDSAIPDIASLFGLYGAPTQSAPETFTGDDGVQYLQWTADFAGGPSVQITAKNADTLPSIIDAVLTGVSGDITWDLDQGPEIAFYERYQGEQLALNVKPSDLATALTAINDYVNAMDKALGFLAVRLAVQSSGLSSIFSGISYDATADDFVANGSSQLIPLFSNLFTLADEQADPIAYLAEWKPILDIILGNFSQGNSLLLNSYGYLAQNLVGAFEAVNPTNFDFLDAANTLGVPSDLFITGTGEMVGTDEADIFYIDGANQTAEGGLGADNYIVGKHIGTTVITDVEPILSPSSDDTLRFTTIDPGDITATRDGTDLVLTVNATGETVRITDEFTGPFPSPLGGIDAAPDNGVTEIVFADGTVWEKIDMAMAVARVMPDGGTQVGTSATDYFIGGPGDDVMEGAGSSDIYQIGPNGGHDTIDDYEDDFARDSTDIVRFTGGITPDDLTYSRDAGSGDLTVGFKDSDATVTIDGQFTATETGVFGELWNNQIEMFVFDDGEALTAQQIRDRTLQTYETSGNDSIYGFSTDDIITGGTGNDYMSGLNGNDTYVINLGDGQDEIFDNNTNLLTGQDDTIAFGPGISLSDLSFSRNADSNDLLITIGDSGQSVKVDDQFDAIETGAFGVWMPDQIETFSFADGTSITAQDVMLDVIANNETNGNDTIYGFHGDDVLQGGAGNDYMSGEDGNDTYVINVGDGQDEIFDNNTNLLSGQDDTIAFGPGISLSDLTFSRDGTSNDLLIEIGTSGQSVKIDDQFDVTLGWWPDRIENFTFTDGTSISWLDVENDLISQSEGGAYSTIYGFPTDDTLVGGTGDDYMSGLNGNDTYEIGLGGGQDEIYDDNTYLLSGQDDTLAFGVGISLSDLNFSRQGDSDDLLISIGTSGQSVKIDDQFLVTLGWWPDRIENFTFADGTSITSDDIMRDVIANNETSGNDAIYGFDSDDTIEGGAGNDFMSGLNGNDTYIINVGDGQDEIYDDNTYLLSGQNDTLQFGPGISLSDLTFSRVGNSNDLMIAIGTDGQSVKIDDQFLTTLGWWPDQIETFAFSDGSSITAQDVITKLLAQSETSGNDTIYGFASNDTLDGGAGNDYMNGGAGDDTYIFGLGDGIDTIEDPDGNDTVQFGSGIAAANLVVTRDGDDALIQFKNLATGQIGSDELRISTEFDEFENSPIENFTFTDDAGTSLTRQDLVNLYFAQAKTAGNDTIVGTQGNDVLDGGFGDDLLEGGDGDDTYIFDRHDGHDTILDYNGNLNYSSVDTVAFGSGIAPGDITAIMDGSNLLLTVAGSSDTLTIDNFFGESFYWIENFTFTNGTTWDRSDVLSMLQANAIEGTTGDDTLTGTSGADTFDGKGGNDVEIGNGGGGVAGLHDTFIYNLGYGDLDIKDVDTSSTDPDNVLQFGSDITPSDVSVKASGNDIIFTLSDGGQVRAEGAYDSENAGVYDEGIQSVQFSDGTVWTRSQIVNAANSAVTFGTTGNDTLTGSSAEDYFDGLGGDDVETGNAGNDTFLFNSGYGHLEIGELDIFGTGPDSTLAFGAGIDPDDVTVSSNTNGDLIFSMAGGDQVTIDHMGSSNEWGVNLIKFSDGTTWTRAEAYAMAATGSTGSDNLYGSQNADVFDGKGGNDFEQGNGGSDTFKFDAGYGQLEISETDISGLTAILQLGAGINSSNVTVTGDSGGDILLNLGGGDTIKLDGMGFYNDEGVSSIDFADGTVWTHAEVQAMSTIGTIEGDQLYGTTAADYFDGKGGNDKVVGYGGADTIVFNAGYGHLEISEFDLSGAQSNLQFGSGILPSDVEVSTDPAGDIFLTIGTSGDVVALDGMDNSSRYGVGTVTFANDIVWTAADVIAAASAGTGPIYGSSGNDRLSGTAGADTFDGMGGIDYEQGNGGSDIFRFDSGYGSLEISESSTSESDESVLAFGTGIEAASVTVSVSGDNVIFADGVSGDSVTVDGMASTSSEGVQSITFSDGTTWSRAHVEALLLNPVTGTTGGENITGTSGNDLINGLGGSDIENGNGGNDTFVFDSGYGHLEVNETDFASGKTESLLLGSGILPSNINVTADASGNVYLTDGVSGDQIKIDNELGSTYYGIDTLSFADGTTWSRSDLIAKETTGTAGSDSLYGTGGADIFDGKGGADTEVGGGGGDTFKFDSDYGHLEVNEIDFSGSSNNVLQFGAGINPSDVSVTADASGNLYLTDGISGDQVKIDGQLSASYYGLESVSFANGTTWSRSDLVAKETTGTTGNDNLYGTGAAETFDGKGGNDYEQGNGGNDTFVYNVGYGDLEIDQNSGASASNVLQLGSGIDPSDVKVTSNGSDLFITDGVTGDRIQLYEQSALSNIYGIQSIHFAGGTVWNEQDIFANEEIGTTGNDTIYGTSASETIDGKGGNDFVNGGGGSDTFIYNSGYGHLEIEQNSGSSASSVLQLGTGIVSSDVEVTNNGSDILLTDGVSGDQIQLYEQFALSSIYGVHSVEFADGTQWSSADLIAAAGGVTISGTTGNDNLTGTSGADIFDGKGGNDFEAGDGGNDVFKFGSGYGDLEIYENDANSGANNTLQFGAGISASDISVAAGAYGDLLVSDAIGDTVDLDNELYSGWGVQSVVFANGTTLSRQDLLNDATTFGTTGNDSLSGSSAPEIFDGKGGNDFINGGGGNDTFVFNSGYGDLEIFENDSNTAANNTLLLGIGINPGDISVAVGNYNDLQVSDATGDTVDLDNEIYGSSWGIQKVAFANGTTLDRQDLLNDATTFATGSSTTVTGSSGADLFQAGAGVTQITGDGGADTYIFAQGDGALTINNAGGSSAHGELEFSDQYTDEDLWFTQSGNNLVVQTIGSSDKVTVAGWFGSDASAKLSEITIDGTHEIDSHVNSLISAMATFANDNPGFNAATATAMPTNSTLQAAIAAAWHS